MYQEMRTKDDAWMQSIHESIDQLSEILDSMPKDGTALQNDDEYLCDKEVAYMLKVSRRTLSEYRSNGTLPYYVLGGKVLYMTFCFSLLLPAFPFPARRRLPLRRGFLFASFSFGCEPRVP